MKIRSTPKLTAAVAFAGCLIALVAVTSAGGCAANTSKDWAQTSPVIAPAPSGEPLVGATAVATES